MAEAVVIMERRRSVFGHLRAVAAKSVTFAATGDTWTVRGIKRIEQVNLVPTTATAVGFTTNGNVITLVAGAGVTCQGAAIGL